MCFENVNMIVELRPKKHVISQFVSFPHIYNVTLYLVLQVHLWGHIVIQISRQLHFRIWAPAPRTASEIRNGIDTPG